MKIVDIIIVHSTGWNADGGSDGNLGYIYQYCLAVCEPRVNDWEECALIYCEVKVGGGCGIPNQYRKQEIDACGEEFSVEQLARCAC